MFSMPVRFTIPVMLMVGAVRLMAASAVIFIVGEVRLIDDGVMLIVLSPQHDQIDGLQGRYCLRSHVKVDVLVAHLQVDILVPHVDGELIVRLLERPVA